MGNSEMNRFIIDYDVVSIAQSLCDQHIVKMPLEESQMLCTALWHHAPEYAEENNLYKPVHQKHPCTLWAMHSRDNYEFAWNLYFAMCQEYRLRYNRFHGCGKHEDALRPSRVKHFLPDLGLTKHPQCFSGHDDLKTDEFMPVNAYRKFYYVDKMRFARYNKCRHMPDWLNEMRVDYA